MFGPTIIDAGGEGPHSLLLLSFSVHFDFDEGVTPVIVPVVEARVPPQLPAFVEADIPLVVGQGSKLDLACGFMRRLIPHNLLHEVTLVCKGVGSVVMEMAWVPGVAMPRSFVPRILLKRKGKEKRIGKFTSLEPSPPNQVSASGV